jgi:hypothetical protein
MNQHRAAFARSAERRVPPFLGKPMTYQLSAFRLGGLMMDRGVGPVLHTFVASQAPGWEISVVYNKFNISGLIRPIIH